MTLPGEDRPVLLLCFHNHQPVGNFESVLQEATEKSYLPFLRLLSEYPGVRVTLHYTGDLLHWLLTKREDVAFLLRTLVERGQVELLGGGMYEPILALLPHRDRVGQLRLLSERVRSLSGRPPEGIWLAERVWENSILPSLQEAGVRYLPLDDYHFLRAGLPQEELDGYYITEADGSSVRVFPGSERLRYLIPFGGVEHALDEVERIASRHVPYPAAVFADDGEKFGVWPNTYRSVYEEGWLRRFFEGILARSDRLVTMTFGEYEALAPPRGRVYLPACSYIEMGEWTLPAGLASRFADLLHEFREGRSSGLRPFVQGGYFRSFLRKYEEANQLHKRMWALSARVEEAAGRSDPEAEEARDRLYRSQCNDVYWHGVFGGLYLNHLRDAAWSSLLAAESISDRILHAGEEGWTEACGGDLDLDGGVELLLKTADVTLLLHGHDGGALTEISLPRRGIALGHTLTRRSEGYHGKLASPSGSFDGSTSIHDAIVLKDPSVLEALGEDPWMRASFRDEVHPAGGDDGPVLLGHAPPHSASAGREGSACVEEVEGRIEAEVDLLLPVPGGEASLRKCLTLVAGEEAFTATLVLGNPGRAHLSFRFVSEWNLNFLSGEGVERKVEGAGANLALSAHETARGVSSIRVEDGWRRVAVEVSGSRRFSVGRYPVETASLSEAGAEKIHQALCLRLLFPVELPPGGREEIVLSFRLPETER
jgi:alpha-amylase